MAGKQLSNPFDTLTALTDSMLSPEQPENALVPREDGGFEYKRFLLTPTGMVIPEDVTDDEWKEVGQVIKALETSISWVVGDWANWATQAWDWTCAQVAEAFDYAPETIEAYVSVCRAVPGLIRNQAVSFSHHRLVARMEEHEQRYWLDLAVSQKWTLSQMKQTIRGYDAPALPKAAGREEKQVKTYQSYVQTEKDNVPYMGTQQKQDFADRAQWLGDYYLKLARWALGEEEG